VPLRLTLLNDISTKSAHAKQRQPLLCQAIISARKLLDTWAPNSKQLLKSIFVKVFNSLLVGIRHATSLLCGTLSAKLKTKKSLPPSDFCQTLILNISFHISSYEPPIRLALKECSSTLCCFRKHFHGVLPDIIVRHAFLFNSLLSNAMCGCFVWIEACWVARPCSKMRHIRMDFCNIMFHKRWGTSCLSPQ